MRTNGTGIIVVTVPFVELDFAGLKTTQNSASAQSTGSGTNLVVLVCVGRAPAGWAEAAFTRSRRGCRQRRGRARCSDEETQCGANRERETGKAAHHRKWRRSSPAALDGSMRWLRRRWATPRCGRRRRYSASLLGALGMAASSGTAALVVRA
jgi:hypothetical protein